MRTGTWNRKNTRKEKQDTSTGSRGQDADASTRTVMWQRNEERGQQESRTRTDADASFFVRVVMTASVYLIYCHEIAPLDMNKVKITTGTKPMPIF